MLRRDRVRAHCSEKEAQKQNYLVCIDVYSLGCLQVVVRAYPRRVWKAIASRTVALFMQSVSLFSHVRAFAAEPQPNLSVSPACMAASG